MVLMESNYTYNCNKNNNWRRSKEENFHQYNQQSAGSRPRSQNNRGPSFGWQPSSWEKKFCATAGVPWQKVLETKKYMCMNQDQKVLQWNDSAVEEAFWNAKNRFWAEMHGQPCDITPPDPDIFIDKIDWDSNVDPELFSDLEKRIPDPHSDAQKGNGGVVIGIPVVPEQYLLTPTGWGDMEEGGAQQVKNCEQYQVNNQEMGHFLGWEDEYVSVPRNGNNGSTWNHNYKKQLDQGYKKKWDSGHNWNMSRYKISRFNDNGNYGQSLVDDYGGKKGNFTYERPLIKWRPVTRQW